MWLSKTIGKSMTDSKAQKGSVTVSGSAALEAQYTAGAKNMEAYTPYGYTSAAPIGEEVVVLPSSDGEITLGTRCKASTLQSGEVMISSLGGAKILLKNDGTVVINSMVINREGVINNGI
ncbi:MAG: phage baseplate assembly protein [Eubacterium sp.]|nr:phage baseplate assembly protein [Eubacterium sp.]